MRRNRPALLRPLALALAVAGGMAQPVSRAAKSEEPTARLSIDGTGVLRDREFKSALMRLLDAEKKATLDANALEDAAVILASSLGEEGFQKPQIEIEVTLVDGSRKKNDVRSDLRETAAAAPRGARS